MNKVLVSGILVALLFTALPLILPMLPEFFQGLDYSWLADGDITPGEIVAFVGSILIALSKQGREQLAMAFSAKPAK